MALKSRTLYVVECGEGQYLGRRFFDQANGRGENRGVSFNQAQLFTRKSDARKRALQPYDRVVVVTCSQTSAVQSDQADLSAALVLLQDWLHKDQLHTRQGSFGGRGPSGKRGPEPLHDDAQSSNWRKAKALLVKYGYEVPTSGKLMDG